MDKCKCNAVTKVLGDGCKYCNPQYYIEILEAQQSDCEAETEQLRSELSALQEEAERLRKDAGRYRYARTILNVGFVQRHKPDHDEAYNVEVDEQIDKAIDSLSRGDE